MADFYFQRAGKMHFFCPLCHYHQSTSTIQKMTAKHHLQLAVLTATITFLLWSYTGWKAVAFYFVYWLAFDIFYRLRKREALICQSCGFDPFLYLQDSHLARKALKKHWEERIEKENLFSGLNLKNYKTTPPSKGDAAIGQPENIVENEGTKPQTTASP